MNRNYIYQTIHTLSRHPLYVAQHCRILERAFMEVYFRPLRLDERAIEREIGALLETKETPLELSVFVELRIDIEQQHELVVGEVSLYDGYAFRSITPSAQVVVFDSPFGLYPTSARREVIAFAKDIAMNLGGEVAIECNRKGGVISANGAALFAIKGRKIICPTTIMSVERQLIIEASKAIEIPIEERNIERHELIDFDELIIADHYGVTSISRYERCNYMSIIAQKLAATLATPW